MPAPAPPAPSLSPPVANAIGSAIITVTANDGAASNNLVTQTFNITVNPVNQPPTLNPISDLAINENAGVQTVAQPTSPPAPPMKSRRSPSPPSPATPA